MLWLWLWACGRQAKGDRCSCTTRRFRSMSCVQFMGFLFFPSLAPLFLSSCAPIWVAGNLRLRLSQGMVQTLVRLAQTRCRRASRPSAIGSREYFLKPSNQMVCRDVSSGVFRFYCVLGATFEGIFYRTWFTFEGGWKLGSARHPT
ncbi:hypothetical protein QBC33DRAFT_529683 [Phialemonium atrogriseum]|uniref:Secreted protein n=1 Tax=Phialemonium atrogriseum TaxID=1093897 RepID=A0AAJ0FP69_9PEZI|nr:uncharacterized protein QBC33DRAFT_529683 [Phialemonium atrogriseum]KAK1769948.1 hypothetical protein QBC33DRAFT_529683 [Phialemonium atrogriseum]